MNQPDLFTVPVHRDDPESSRRAARRALGAAVSQKATILGFLREVGEDSAIHIRDTLFADQPIAANKVQTRLRTLQREGLVEPVKRHDFYTDRVEEVSPLRFRVVDR